MKKVYCSECKYITLSEFCIEADCNHPENEEVCMTTGDWLYRPKQFYRNLQYPKEINKNNDCKWFEEK